MNANAAGIQIAMVQMAIANDPMQNAAALLAAAKKAAAEAAHNIVS
jgi:predicted amidohydrolase